MGDQQPNGSSTDKGTVYFGVKFRFFDKVYPIQKLQIPVVLNDYVVVETNRGKEFGIIALRKQNTGIRRPRTDIVVKRLVRKATARDIEAFKQLDGDEKEAFIQCVRKNKNFKFQIKFFRVEKIYDGSRYIIYYKRSDADANKKGNKRKPNFSPFIQEMTAQLKSKIELREVGSRGEAKIFGGVGNCGKTLCCVDWNKKGSAVTVKMAKEQGLAINIPKLSGVCGRLMCCIAYEKEQYQDGSFIRD